MRFSLAASFVALTVVACSAGNRVSTTGTTGATEGSGGAGPAGSGGASSSGAGLHDGGPGGETGAGGGSGDGGISCTGMLNQEGCSCGAPGATRACYTGAAGTENVGTCHDGSQTCQMNGEFGTWGPCTGDVVPAAENCADTLDHNCNALTGCNDPVCVGLPGCCAAGMTRSCYDGPSGTAGVGPCHGGTQLCDAVGSWGPCMGEALPGQEIGHCGDGIDNDCNGLTDCKDFFCLFDPKCLPKSCTAGATQPCYDGPAGTAGVGPCHGGTQTCAADGSAWGPCTGEALPQAEGGHCTDGLDNNCNGLVDCADPACATAPGCCTVVNNPPDGTIWANSPDTLYRIDPVTFGVTTVGSFGVADQITDVAVAVSGGLYAISFTSLYSVSKVTGAATFIADVPGTGNNSLTFLPSGKLLASDSSGEVKIIDPASGASTDVGNYGGGLVSSGDLIAVKSGILYGTSSTTQGGGDASGNNVLLRVDVATGAATPVGPTGYGDVWGLAYSGARVIGFTTGGQILKIDPQTGAGTVLATPGVLFWGAGQSPLVADNACP